MREHLKAIRTREESLDDLKRRRRNVHRKAEDAEKKLSKMSPEHKNLQLQTETLNRLRDEIRTMDSDIMLEEAALGDFKRTATRMFMGLKFGGLQECCEKGQVWPTLSTSTGLLNRCRSSQIMERESYLYVVCQHLSYLPC